MIRELDLDYEILLTSRPLANTIELLDLYGFTHHVIGKHYGKNLLKKIFGFTIRIMQFYSFFKNEDIDVAISHSSFYSPLVSKLLGMRCIYLNDNEHAAGNRISFIFADTIMIPEYLAEEKVVRQWAKLDKIIKYPGVKEGIYLWNYNSKQSGRFQLSNSDGKGRIFIRPEPWTAQYYQGGKNFLDDLLVSLKDRCRIFLLPRDELQKKYYQQVKFAGVFVSETSISLNDIMENCDLFIGAGGTMTREAAVLGIPTISIYQDKLLDVDKYLIKKGYMIHKKDLNAGFVIDYLDKMGKKPPAKELLRKGKEAYELIKCVLLDTGKLK
jgi:predicted glycosyltransferase